MRVQLRFTCLSIIGRPVDRLNADNRMRRRIASCYDRGVKQDSLQIRDASPADIDALTAIRYAETPAVHRDRIEAATSREVRYRVAQIGDALVGFGMLVLRWPKTWPRSETPEPLPQIIDLFVAETERGRGIGGAMVADMEELAVGAGYGAIFMRVDPIDNPRAQSLYERLGYRAIQTEPFRSRWQFTDSDGTVHQGEEWALDMAKELE